MPYRYMCYTCILCNIKHIWGFMFFEKFLSKSRVPLYDTISGWGLGDKKATARINVSGCQNGCKILPTLWGVARWSFWVSRLCVSKMRESYFSDPSKLYLQKVSVSIVLCIYYVSDVYVTRCMAAIRETKESPMEVGFQDIKEVTHVAGVPLIGCNQGPHGIYLLDSLGTRELTQLSIAPRQSSPMPTTQSSSSHSQQPGPQSRVSLPMPQSGPPSVTQRAR